MTCMYLVRTSHPADAHDPLPARATGRTDHLTPPSLLPSRLAALGAPGADESGSAAHLARPVDQLVTAHLNNPTTTNPTEALL